MNIIEKRVKDLKPYEKNPRLNDDAVKYVAESIKNFGFKVPLVIDKDNNIVCGHTRWKACKKLKIDTVPCVVADDLTEEQIRAYRLADNRVAEKAEWDLALLDTELAEIETIDMTLLGFDDKEETPQEVVEDDFDIEPPEEPKAKYGDLYQLGRHKLLCGDSTKIEDVQCLMGGHKADMVFTDPPYNIGYQGVNDKRTIKNDKMDDSDFLDFLEKSLMVCDTAYVCCSWQYSHLFKKAMTDLGMPPKAMIVWNKVNPAQHLDKYFKQHEIIFYFGKFGGEKTIRGDVWEVKRQVNTVHPTMKPIELIAMALQDNPQKNSVYDGFGGSGSTLIACEQTNKVCFMMELDPRYIDVIIERWEKYTGQKAVKLNAD